ncbi:DUF4382 domain-containing protein [Candidatus Woesearchaeota archaeon]|nr:DUF4382 domain-containing protein [Candidatus Woesearchaeota archaeon]
MKKLIVVALLAFSLFIASCTLPGGKAGTGTLVLKLTDHENLDYNKVLVTISQIEVHKDGNWTIFSSNEQTFDLIQLESVAVLLGQQQLPVGKYTQIRLLVTKAQVEIPAPGSQVTSQLVDVTVPSDKIKIVREFTIEENKTTELIIDFDPDSVKQVGEQYIMTPVIKILTPSEFEEKIKQNKKKEINASQQQNVSSQTKKKELIIELDDYGTYPNKVTVNKGDMVKITFKVRGNNVYYGGLDIKSELFDTGKIPLGGTKIVEFTAEKTFTFTSYWPSSSVKKADGTVEVV